MVDEPKIPEADTATVAEGQDVADEAPKEGVEVPKPPSEEALRRPPEAEERRYKHLEQVLPPLSQQTAEQLATPAGVNLLTAITIREMHSSEVVQGENTHLRNENRVLAEHNARLQERLGVYGTFKWIPTAGIPLGGVIVGIAIKILDAQPGLAIALLGVVAVLWTVCIVAFGMLKPPPRGDNGGKKAGG